MTKARTLADNFAADINGITAGTGITGGGTSGTVTVTNSMATEIDAKGDLVVGTGADTFSRLAVASTAGYLLSVDSNETTGLKWAAPAAGGKVLQVVQSVYSTEFSMSSSTFADTGLSVSITPSSASSKVLVLVSQPIGVIRAASSAVSDIRLVRDSTAVFTFKRPVGGVLTGVTDMELWATAGFSYLDSPSTTSATTYKTQVASGSSYETKTNVSNSNSSIIALEIGA